MDHQKEYHDPDYPETSGRIKEEQISVTEDEKAEKIRRIVRQEFSKELEAREDVIMTIDQRMSSSRRLLHRLRYSIVSGYYLQQKLQLSASQLQDEWSASPQLQATSSMLREGQRRIHPSVRKLLGKKTVDLDEILLGSRAPRQNARKDYCAMLQSRNYTIPADSTKSLRPGTLSIEPDKEKEKPRKVPKHQQPKIEKVLTLDEATRNQMKHRYRIIIGNTSKYAPGASQLDRSTHKWLLYVRGVHGNELCGAVVTAVTCRLHHSYAPHHTVSVTKPPFHISRRGWGEFPAKIEMHFAMPERNKPAVVEHTIKLDRNYTGLQTLGAETIVDVWLYSTPEMLKYEHNENIEIDNPIISEENISLAPVKTEPADVKDSNDMCQIENDICEIPNDNGQENWLDFFSNTTEMDVDEMFVKPAKKCEKINQFQEEEEEIVHSIKKERKSERSDVENLIETNVIKRENHNTTENDEMYNEPLRIGQTIDLSKVKTEIEDWTPNVIHNSNNVIHNSTNVIYNSTNAIHNPNNVVHNSNNVIHNSTNVIHNCKMDAIEDLPNELLVQSSSPKKRIMKYMDPTTGKIYYLEMDRNLDLSKVQEIVINSKGNVKTAKISPIKPNGLKNVRKNSKKGGVSLLRPEVKNLLKKDEMREENPVCNTQKPVPDKLKATQKPAMRSNKEFTHIDNDHCYLGYNFIPNSVLPTQSNANTLEEIQIKKEQSLYDLLCAAIKRFSSIRTAVNYLLKKIPFITSEARDPDFVKNFPFVVENEERFWKLDFAKRRNIEWSRAKLINNLLSEHFSNQHDPIWRTKQILIFSRLHGYYPIRTETMLRQTEKSNYNSWLDVDNSNIESNIKEIYPNPNQICSLTKFDSISQNQSFTETIEIDSDEEIDIVECDQHTDVKKEIVLPEISQLVLPVEDDEDRLRFLYIERKCADIGMELRNEDVGNGYSYSAVHAVLLSAVKSFAEELIRGALADKLQRERKASALPPVWIGSSSWRAPICLENVLSSSRQSRMSVVDLSDLGTERKDHCAI